jgi:hypothetical protein
MRRRERITRKGDFEMIRWWSWDCMGVEDPASAIHV